MDLSKSEVSAKPTTLEPGIVRALEAIVGAEAVLTSLEQRTFFSTDIASRGVTAEAIVQVDDVRALSKVVRACTERGYIVIPRGGGFSYTGGYTPTETKTVLVDLRPMNRIVEINTEDMYVVVEAGCTWERLYEALKAKGVRTPYFGPMSGYRATVGGALSQGSFFLGSTQFGTVSDSVLGLEVVLADGTILKTGSGASDETPNFFRQFGPDATGLFLNDTGAMGFKARAVLRLIPFPSHQAYGTFEFTSYQAAAKAVSEIGRSCLVAECYCWDPYFVKLMAAASTGTKEDLRFLLNVIKAGSGLIDGLSAAARIAFFGRRVFSGDTWLMHVVIDDASALGAAAKLKLVRAMARAGGGNEVSPSAPRTLRGTPFTNFNVPERRTSLRNLPVHGLSPHSRAPAVAADVYTFLNAHKDEMDRIGIQCGVIFFAVGAQAMCIEPLIYWNDEEHFLHNRVEERSDIAALDDYAERSEATKTALALRDELKALFRRHGCIHMQIGRAYPWRQTREAATLKLLTTVKDAVDPNRLVNRGSLGFGGHGQD
jgi:FAD/FMN-containing dehydrogenase